MDYGALLQGAYRQIAWAFVATASERAELAPPVETPVAVAAALLVEYGGRVDGP